MVGYALARNIQRADASNGQEKRQYYKERHSLLLHLRVGDKIPHIAVCDVDSDLNSLIIYFFTLSKYKTY